MDASTFLALPMSPGPTGPQSFALFVNFFFPALALLVVSIRVAGRVAANQFAVDDWLVCIAMLMSIAETVISFFFIKTNFIGIPPERVPPHDRTQGLIWAYAVQILYNPILALVKSSVLIFLTRLFGQKDGVRRFLLWLNVANISQLVAVFFAIVLQCLPIQFNWDPTLRGGRCVDRRILYISTAAFNIVTDFLILGLPLWIFSSLRIPKRTKIALLVVFLLGFLVTITSIIRLLLVAQGVYNVGIFPSEASTNNVGFVTSAIETNLALITASAPALRPIFRSRDRGGWFARSVMATATPGRAAPPTTNDSADVEMGQDNQHKPSIGWNTRSHTHRDSSPVVGSKFGRGGSRGGRKGSYNHITGRQQRPSQKPIIRVRTTGLAGAGRHEQVLLRSSSPRPSEEQAMTYNGIMRVSDVRREIEGIVKDIAVAGAGTFTSAGTPVSRGANRTPPPPPRTPRTPRTPKPTTPPRPRPSMETIFVGATMVSPPPPRPSTSGSGAGTIRRAAPAPERYYSESIYPEQGLGKAGEEEEDDDDRVSRYLGRRFGVVTPRGTTPTSRGWEGSGRPF
ncbi:uncharacterized protein B0T15DRAFT_496765 [Chaetomium strumarium]|uniref:Rhodopsin domain-containing protein n=1 Tax=Chaetomium strumarium TaxID=1170767 RepID=A0AAJ0GLV2_9PEZI|nr:hypothetical protein B0T15DRAFT_496765 [Chaetomium strumarium]